MSQPCETMSQPPTPAYVYEPLHFQDSIRLLELLPGPKDSALQCKIIEVRRGDTPKYEALSYAWGELVFPHTIEEVASDTCLSITVNLYTALQAIRYEKRSRLLWIDAICINQVELKEKSHQVAAMGDIFADAWRVIVWLRSHIWTSEHIVKLLESFNGWLEQDSYRSMKWLDDLKFFVQPWYSRVWVVQEFILAREVLFMTADKIIHFNLFDEAVQTMLDCSRHANVIEPSVKKSSFENMTESLWLMSRLFRYRAELQEMGLEEMHTQRPRAQHVGMSLAQCVTELCLGRDCKEDRDRIYGVLAIARNDLGITVDYDLPLHVVYNDFAVRSLLSGDPVLLHTSGLRPDHQPEFRSFTPHLVNQACMTFRFDARELGFRAPTRPFTVVPSTTGHLPCIRGVKLDIVYRTGDILQPRSVTCDVFPDHRKTLSAIEVISSNFADWLSTSAIPPKYPNWVSTVWNLVPERDNLQWKTVQRQWAEAGSCIRWAVVNNYNGFDVEKATCLKNRHVFQTQQGYIGFGPFWMKPGDLVVMFEGTATPFIIRKNMSEEPERSDT